MVLECSPDYLLGLTSDLNGTGRIPSDSELIAYMAEIQVTGERPTLRQWRHMLKLSGLSD